MANSSAARAAGRPPASKIIFWNALSAGKTFDMRDLGQALDHWHDGPAHDRGGPFAKLKHNLPPVAGDRGTKSKPISGPHLACGFLTTSPNATVQHGGQRPRRLAKGKGARDARTKHKV